MITDPVGDMLTRIRNGILVRHERVEMPLSRLKREIAGILKSEGFIQDFEVREEAPAAGVTRSVLPLTSTLTPNGNSRLVAPLGPLIETVRPSSLNSTPSGIGTGRLPMRDSDTVATASTITTPRTGLRRPLVAGWHRGW